MGCVSTREKFNTSEESHIVNRHDKNYILKMLILGTDYEKYTFKVREDPEDAFNDILKTWSKLSKVIKTQNVNEKSFPDISKEFEDIEESFLDETSLDVPATQEEFKQLVRKNTIALKNLEVVQVEGSNSGPNTPKFSFSKLLVEKIKEVGSDRNPKGIMKKESMEGFGPMLSARSREARASGVSFDILSKPHT